MMAFSGIAIAIACAIEAWVSAPVGFASSTSACGLASAGSGAERGGQRLKRGDRILSPRRHAVDLAALGLQQARLVRIGEERDGIVGLDQNDVS